MRLPKINTDSPRVWFNLLIIVLFILLFLFPQPAGIIFSIARILVIVGLIFSLFSPMLAATDNGKKPATQRVISAIEPIRPGHHLGQGRQFYEELLENVFDLLNALNVNYDSAFYMIDPMSNGYTLQKATNTQFSEFISFDNEIIQTILKQNESMIFQQKDIGPAWSAILEQAKWRGSECLLGIRILYRGATAGCLIIFTEHFNEIEQRDRDLLASLGAFLSSGIEKIERIEELIADRENYSRITDLLVKIDIRAEQSSILEAVGKLCNSLFSYDKLTISLVNDNKKSATVMLVDGFSEDINLGGVFEIDNTLHGRPIRTGGMINSAYWERDYDDEGRFIRKDMENYHFMAVVGSPLHINSTTKGAIVIERLSSRQFTESDVWLLESLAQTINTLLDWTTKYKIVHQHATHDGLTGLINHKSFIDRFEEEISRSLRFQQDLVLLMMDLDKFKRINDTHGHLYGDYVLQEMAQQFKKCVRNIDVIARYGGEEFAILLINTNKKKAKAVAERIVKTIAGHKFNRDGIAVRMTISIGMAQFPLDADRIKDMIAKSDAAMYRVKAQGGNSVALHEV